MSASISAASANAATSTAQTPRLAGDFNTFLKLLTTQIKNQSPTDPLDTNQMTSQLVQFASVEQQVAMNQNLQRLLTLEQASQLTASAPSPSWAAAIASLARKPCSLAALPGIGPGMARARMGFPCRMAPTRSA